MNRRVTGLRRTSHRVEYKATGAIVTPPLWYCHEPKESKRGAPATIGRGDL